MSLNTRRIVIDPASPEPHIIEQAARVVRDGGLVAFPTETVYGLGADALNASATARIFEAKGRPETDPLIVHIDSIEQLARVAVDIPQLAYNLAHALWPGPLTLVLSRHPDVARNVSAGRNSVAVRMPDHPVARALIAASGVPIAAPSANLFTRPSPTTARHVLDDLDGRIDMVLDGGPTAIGLESTVLDLTAEPPEILRPGGVPPETLRQFIPQVTFRPRYTEVGHAPASPGMMLKHYSPRARLMLFSGEPADVIGQMRDEAQSILAKGQTIGLMTYDEEQQNFADLKVQVLSLGSINDVFQIGRNLFHVMRDLDSRGVDVIFVRAVPAKGLGAAIHDRLLRAAEGRLIHVPAPDHTPGP
jgi:L-threonylcarbamoyladenylate synthase